MRQRGKRDCESKRLLIANELQINVFAIFAAACESFNCINECALFFRRSCLANAPQLRNQFVHLQVIENSLAPGIDVTQEVIALIVPGREEAAEKTFEIGNFFRRFALPGFQPNAHSHSCAPRAEDRAATKAVSAGSLRAILQLGRRLASARGSKLVLHLSFRPAPNRELLLRRRISSGSRNNFRLRRARGTLRPTRWHRLSQSVVRTRRPRSRCRSSRPERGSLRLAMRLWCVSLVPSRRSRRICFPNAHKCA